MMIDSEHAQPLGYVCKHKPRNLLTMKVEDALVVDLPTSRAVVEPFHLRMSVSMKDNLVTRFGPYNEAFIIVNQEIPSTLFLGCISSHIRNRIRSMERITGCFKCVVKVRPFFTVRNLRILSLTICMLQVDRIISTRDAPVYMKKPMP